MAREPMYSTQSKHEVQEMEKKRVNRTLLIVLDTSAMIQLM